MSVSTNAPFRRAAIFQRRQLAGHLEEATDGRAWLFVYSREYCGPPVSLTMPVRAEPYHFDAFPSVFEGLLPEGAQLDALLRMHKIDRNDCFHQLITVGEDLIGSLSVADVTGNATPNPPAPD